MHPKPGADLRNVADRKKLLPISLNMCTALKTVFYQLSFVLLSRLLCHIVLQRQVDLKFSLTDRLSVIRIDKKCNSEKTLTTTRGYTYSGHNEQAVCRSISILINEIIYLRRDERRIVP